MISSTLQQQLAFYLPVCPLPMVSASSTTTLLPAKICKAYEYKKLLTFLQICEAKADAMLDWQPGQDTLCMTCQVILLTTVDQAARRAEKGGGACSRAD